MVIIAPGSPVINSPLVLGLLLAQPRIHVTFGERELIVGSSRGDMGKRYLDATWQHGQGKTGLWR